MSELLSFDEARARLIAAGREITLPIEQVTTIGAVGRTLAEPLVSGVDVPPLDNSSMDGYALRSADAPVAGVRLPVSQRIAAGSIGAALAAGSAARIFTGAPVPPNADAVVMQERCTVDGADIVINQSVSLGDNIRRRGEDIAVGDVVLSAGTVLGAAQLGVAAAVGAASLPVRQRLRVALFSTGDELVMPGQPLREGAIYNSNRYTLYALLTELGCAVSDLGIVPDDLEATREVLRVAAADHELILTSGGVSVGEEDHVKAAVTAEGSLDLWQIAIKPGKPLAHGRLRKVSPGGTASSSGTAPSAAHFIGLPGNPVSSFITFLILVRPFVRAAQGLPDEALTADASLPLRAEFDWPPGNKRESRREFLRVRRRADGGVELFQNQSSGVLTSCAWADGLVDNLPGVKIQRGDTVRFVPMAELLR
jgi:molybdopterin molybdotransferase